MTPKRRKPGSEDPLEAYRRVRKQVPPPQRVVPDRREKLAERAERRARRREPEDEA